MFNQYPISSEAMLEGEEKEEEEEEEEEDEDDIIFDKKFL